MRFLNIFFFFTNSFYYYLFIWFFFFLRTIGLGYIMITWPSHRGVCVYEIHSQEHSGMILHRFRKVGDTKLSTVASAPRSVGSTVKMVSVNALKLSIISTQILICVSNCFQNTTIKHLTRLKCMFSLVLMSHK